MQKMTKPGNVPITRVGHTYSTQHGSDPNAQVRGRPSQPTPEVFGKGT